MLCGTSGDLSPADRDGGRCPECGSTWRHRAVALGVLVGLRTKLIPLAEYPQDWSRRGVGISDAMPLASRLSSTFDYVNSSYHRFPRLDLLDPPADVIGQFEFVTCSDVLEHIAPPADRALEGLASVLRPDGFAVISVPGRPTTTQEYYPGLTEFELVDGTLRWVDGLGLVRHDPDPDLHLGEGLTLAFRRWGLDDLERRLVRAGFAPPEPVLVCDELGVPAVKQGNVLIARRS
jgi:SAM-dependent methyltransferase